jgi:hypothetical protein
MKTVTAGAAYATIGGGVSGTTTGEAGRGKGNGSATATIGLMVDGAVIRSDGTATDTVWSNAPII